MSVNTAVDFAGIKLKNPVLTASGTFGFGTEFSDFGDLAALGGLVVKGLSLKPRAGNPMPRIAETPAGMLNAIGIQNPGVSVFVKNILPRLPHDKTAVLANLYGCDVDQFAELADILSAEQGVAGLEVNVSCPNVAQGGVLFGQDPSMVGKVTEAVKRRARDTPVIIKLSPNVTDIAACARAAAAGGADGLTCINTLAGMAVDARTRRPRLANVRGGLSGPAIKPVALRCVYDVCKVVDIPVFGVGGISSVEDVFEFLLVGAAAVQVGTANFLRPDFAFRLAGEVDPFMERLGIRDLDEYRGGLVLE